MRYFLGFLLILAGAWFAAVGASEFSFAASEFVGALAQDLEETGWASHLKELAGGSFIYGLLTAVVGCTMVLRSR